MPKNRFCNGDPSVRKENTVDIDEFQTRPSTQQPRSNSMSNTDWKIQSATRIADNIQTVGYTAFARRVETCLEHMLEASDNGCDTVASIAQILGDNVIARNMQQVKVTIVMDIGPEARYDIESFFDDELIGHLEDIDGNDGCVITSAIVQDW